MDIIQPSEIAESWEKTFRDPVNKQVPHLQKFAFKADNN